MEFSTPLRSASVFFFVLCTCLTGTAEASHRLVPVSTSVELRDALSSLQDGDVIELAPGSYTPMGPSGQSYLFISNPAVSFTVRAEVPGSSFIDGGLNRRLMDFDVSNPSLAGWAVFEGLVFRNGSTTAVGDAGGLMLRGAHATFVDCVFEDNRAIPNVGAGASAGGVQIVRQADVQFVGCEFKNNTTDNHGGGMLVGQGSRVVIHDSLFEGNRSNVANHRTNSLGGAIHAFNSESGTTTRLHVSNTRFLNNEAGFVGGAIQAKGNFVSAGQPVASPTEILVVNSTFDSNLAEPFAGVVNPSPSEGGAIMAENNVDVVIVGSRFWNNEGGFGGAISGNRVVIDVTTSEFRNNVAFGRATTSTTGRGGAINAHSNDSCADSTNYRSASVTVSDSFFEGNEAQLGGGVYVVGDRNRMFGVSCPQGTLNDNRATMTIENVILSGCSVDDLIGNHSHGGALYGSLVDFTLSDTLVLDSTALGTDPTNVSSPSKGFGGGVAVRAGSALSVTNTVFAGNSADHEGGGLHLVGTVIEAFSNNTFLGNTVSPGATRPEHQSIGAALYVGPDTQEPFEASGAIEDSFFSGNLGLAIYDHDTLCPSPCVRNLATYEGNAFEEASYGTKVFYNTRQPTAGVALTPADLNAVVIDRGGGSTTNKSPGGGNATDSSWLPAGFLDVAPDDRLSPTGAGDPAQNSESFVAWAWDGGCAELNGAPLAGSTGFSSGSAGSQTLEVFDIACAGAPDVSVAKSIIQAASLSASLTASPVAISGGQSSTLSWSVPGGDFISGLISHDASSELPGASGNVGVTPAETTEYRLFGITLRGGVTDAAEVAVDEPATDVIFADGFESGTLSAWGG